MTCINNPNPAPTSSGPNVGAIAGGVVGGIAFVVIVVFMVYWFWIKKRREEQDAELEEEWQQDDITSQKRNTRFTSMHDAASTRTRGSLANSILSRASNTSCTSRLSATQESSESRR
jgi:protein OPY2